MQRDPPAYYTPRPGSFDSLPNPGPPTWLKPQLYIDADKFRFIDEHAIAVAQVNHRDFKQLLWNLVDCSDFSDVEKVRIIFRWMTSKNMLTIFFEHQDEGSAEDVVAGFKSKKSTYARIFYTLCCYAGIPCVLLNGIAKGVEYRPGASVAQYRTGSRIPDAAFNHSWNAVFLEGCWQLIDCHWATRYLQTEKSAPETIVYEYDDYYFFTDPHHLIYSHFPEDPQWQLLRKPLTLDEFETLPLAKSYFFKAGLQFWSHNKGVLSVPDGYLKLTLGFGRIVAFTYKLTKADTMSDSHNGIKLSRYVFQEVCPDHINYYLRAPCPGRFYLTIFVEKMIDGGKKGVETVYNSACEYLLNCEKAAGITAPYPQTAEASWGVGPFLQQYGLVPTIEGGSVGTETSSLQVTFNKTFPAVNTLYKLVHENYSEERLDECIDCSDTDTQSYCNISLPNYGEYMLELYANNPMTDEDRYTNVAQYLVGYGTPEGAIAIASNRGGLATQGAPSVSGSHLTRRPSQAGQHHPDQFAALSKKSGQQYGVQIVESYTPEMADVLERVKGIQVDVTPYDASKAWAQGGPIKLQPYSGRGGDQEQEEEYHIGSRDDELAPPRPPLPQSADFTGGRQNQEGHVKVAGTTDDYYSKTPTGGSGLSGSRERGAVAVAGAAQNGINDDLGNKPLASLLT